MRYTLGHGIREVCPMSKATLALFTVIHTDGLHRVSVDYCGCVDAPELWRQLMRVQWWPATVLDPRTAVTFQCLRQFEKLNGQGQITATDYYRGLTILTDATRLVSTPVRAL
jgi:hypothetical protein